ncbi:hypothetical protein [Aeromonas sp. R7-1]|uniref:hypothetical protein n=1 Tax=Aeromonas sp. R7-1 TaxID=3138473 RepID=UPI0034A2AEA0
MIVKLIEREIAGIGDELDVLPFIQQIGSPAAMRHYERRVTELNRSLVDLDEVIQLQAERGTMPRLDLSEVRQRVQLLAKRDDGAAH